MAVTLTGTGGLFTRLGKIGGAYNDANTHLGTTMKTNIDEIEAQYASSDQELIDTLYTTLESHRSQAAVILGDLQALAEATVIEMVDDDAKLSEPTLQLALEELISQMESSSDDIELATISLSAVTAGGSNNGTGKMVTTLKRGDGLTEDYVFDEDLVATCDSDVQSGGTENSETFTIVGEAAAETPSNWQWPLGSGASVSVTVVDPAIDASATGNLLTNSDFEDFTTANTPDNWTILVGAAGTDILEESTETFDSSDSSLEFTHDAGNPLSSVAQTLNDATGSSATLEPNTVYHFGVWMKKTAGLTGLGTIAIDLVDGSNNVISDDESNSNQVTQALASLTTSWGFVSGTFVTPRVLPATYKIRVHLTVAIADSGQSVYIENLALTPAVKVYNGGPSVSIFAGETNFIIDDKFTLPVNNDEAGAFALLLERWFSLRDKGLRIPSDASPSINDSLVS